MPQLAAFRECTIHIFIEFQMKLVLETVWKEQKLIDGSQIMSCSDGTQKDSISQEKLSIDNFHYTSEISFHTVSKTRQRNERTIS